MSGTTRRALVIVAVVALVIAAAEVGVRAIDDRLPRPDGWSIPELPYKLELVNGRAKATVLFVGSSVMDAGLDPTLFDERFHPPAPSFNGSLGASSLNMVEFATTELWIPRLRPELVVLGISSRDLNANDPRQLELDQRFFDAPEVERALGTGNVSERLDRWLGDRSALWRHRTALRSWEAVMGDATPRWGPALTAADGQYLDFRDGRYEPSDAQFEFVRQGPLREWAVGPQRVEAVAELIRTSRADGARIVLVDMPTSADLVHLHPRGAADVERYHAVLDRLAAQSDVPLLRFDSYPAELMADVLHLNGEGVERFTNELAQRLRSLGLGVGRG